MSHCATGCMTGLGVNPAPGVEPRPIKEIEMKKVKFG